MANEWKITALGELCEFRAGCVFKPALQGKTSGDYPFVKVSDMNLPANAVRIQDANNWVSESDLSELGANPFPPGTVIFAKIGEALRQNRLRQVIRETIIDNNMMGAIPRTGRMDPRFFYYVLSQFDFSEIAQGTALPYLIVSSLSGLAVELPTLPEQRAIAHILGTLDDKIELNRRMNETLEAMARAIFKSWFVDFDPVIDNALRAGNPIPSASAEKAARRRELLSRAKAEGRDSCFPKHIADLFPDRFVDSGLGPIPAGWEMTKLGKIADVNWGDTNVTKKSYVSDGFLAYSAKGPDGFLPYYDFDRVGIVLSAIGANAGCTWLARGKWSCIKNTIRFWATDPQISTEYLFFWTYGNDFWPIRGSAQPFISQTDARNLQILYPSNGIAKIFGQMLEPFFWKINKNECESRTLAAVRNRLMPKLISGEIRISKKD
jgi:type I restriction enzyme S subunit